MIYKPRRGVQDERTGKIIIGTRFEDARARGAVWEKWGFPLAHNYGSKSISHSFNFEPRVLSQMMLLLWLSLLLFACTKIMYQNDFPIVLILGQHFATMVWEMMLSHKTTIHVKNVSKEKNSVL